MLTELDVKEILGNESAETKRLKAEAIQARRDAEAAEGWYNFLKKFTGTAAANRGFGNKSDPNRCLVYYDCTANNQLIENWLADSGLRATAANIERAFLTLRKFGQLAEGPSPRADYEQQAKSSEGRMSQQIRPEVPAPAPFVELSREEILAMTKTRKGITQLRLLMKKGGPQSRIRIDEILQGRG